MVVSLKALVEFKRNVKQKPLGAHTQAAQEKEIDSSREIFASEDRAETRQFCQWSVQSMLLVGPKCVGFNLVSIHCSERRVVTLWLLAIPRKELVELC
jgi:hypothetical protein